MAHTKKRRMYAVIDEYGVPRWVLPRSNTAKTAMLGRIMRLAYETNAEFPDLSASMPPGYAYFVERHQPVQMHSNDPPES